MNKTGRFISIEGIEGVGKTTAMRFIENYLVQKNIQFILTREPGGTPIAERLRQILLSPDEQEAIDPVAELLLMFACRAQHLSHVVLPALRANQWVVSDRFVDASYAYQGGGRQMKLDKIKVLDKWVVQETYPDITILLDAPPHIGLARAKHRGEQDRIEQEKIDFFERVRAVYLARATLFPERFHVIDATQSLEQVQEQMRGVLDFTVAK